jgi:predicted DNA-binding transcriptional regulator YafY
MKTLITQAIQQRRMLRLIYKGKPRTVEPHALGVTEDQKEAMLCWQVSPPTLGKEHWQLFYLDRISGMRMVDQPIELPDQGRRPPMNELASIFIVL